MLTGQGGSLDLFLWSSVRKGATVMGKAAVWAAAAAALGLVGGCTAPPAPTSSRSPASTSPGTAGTASSVVTSPAGTWSPKKVCEGAFSASELLAWAPGTVAEFRAYRSGGPAAQPRLAHAFPDIPASTRGAWCGVKDGPDATHWWVVVVGHDAASLITIHGPGEGVVRGLLPLGPYVP